jgi:hypothetical protein
VHIEANAPPFARRPQHPVAETTGLAYSGDRSDDMHHDDGRQFFVTWFDRLWTKLDASVIEDMCVEDVCVWGLEGKRVGRAQFAAFYQALRASFPEGLAVSVDEALARDTTVMARCTARGRAKNGSDVAFAGFLQATIVNGRMTEAWNCWDFVALLEQCGPLSPGTLERGFSSIAR